MNASVETIRQQLVELFRQMYELTRPECSRCRVPLSCCSPEYCEMAKEVAAEWGVELTPTGHPTLPFMSDQGCIVPPHLRPSCTLHTCAVNSLGMKLGDEPWNEKYFRVRGEIDELEAQLYDLQNPG